VLVLLGPIYPVLFPWQYECSSVVLYVSILANNTMYYWFGNTKNKLLFLGSGSLGTNPVEEQVGRLTCGFTTVLFFNEDLTLSYTLLGLHYILCVLIRCCLLLFTFLSFISFISSDCMQLFIFFTAALRHNLFSLGCYDNLCILFFSERMPLFSHCCMFSDFPIFFSGSTCFFFSCAGVFVSLLENFFTVFIRLF